MKALASTAAVILATTAIHAADRYVSTDGEYGQDVEGAVCYTDLQTAVTAAQAGETVWVDDGFVCDSGINANKARINITNKAITLRSKSGLVDEAQGLGATIRGPGAFCADPDQARCINSVGSAPVIRGFVLENGYPSGNGGCVAGGGCRLVNCVIRNGKGVRGGGVSSASCENCVITNNVSTEMGGGIYLALDLLSCTIAHNRATLYGGGVGIWAQSAAVYSNCLIFCNAAGQEGGGIALRGSGNIVKAIDCMISNNSTPKTSGGGASCEYSSLRLTDCDIVGNIATNAAGGGLSGCVATDCRIVGNVAQSTGGTYTSGGGAYNCMLTNCVVSFNTNDCAVADKMYSCGGGAYGGTAVGCLFEGNYANFRGGGMYTGASKNCRFIENYALSGGAGTYAGFHYNGLYKGNSGGNCAGAMDYYSTKPTTDLSHVINCTFVGNQSGKGHGFYEMCVAVNCVSWGNTSPSHPYDSAVLAASNCCCEAISAPDAYGCITEDPQFRVVDGHDYHVRNAKCRNASLSYGWMTDAADARSRDVYGRARVIGTAADLGAVEWPMYGFLLMVR